MSVRVEAGPMLIMFVHKQFYRFAVCCSLYALSTVKKPFKSSNKCRG